MSERDEAHTEAAHWKKVSIDIADAAKVERDTRDAEIARLKDAYHRVSNVLDEAKHEAGRPPQPLANYIKDQRNAHAATTAKLGRAVAALQDIVNHYRSISQPASNVERIYSAADAILADADSKAAGEAWRELDECYRLLKVVRGHGMPRGTTYELQQECDTALATVDARRGGE